jgi:hypothetical protein
MSGYDSWVLGVSLRVGVVVLGRQHLQLHTSVRKGAVRNAGGPQLVQQPDMSVTHSSAAAVCFSTPAVGFTELCCL